MVEGFRSYFERVAEWGEHPMRTVDVDGLDRAFRASPDGARDRREAAAAERNPTWFPFNRRIV